MIDYSELRISEIPHTRTHLIGLVAQLAEHWTSIPKVAGSIPTVVRLTFQPAWCGYTLRVTSKTSQWKQVNNNGRIMRQVLEDAGGGRETKV